MAAQDTVQRLNDASAIEYALKIELEMLRRCRKCPFHPASIAKNQRERNARRRHACVLIIDDDMAVARATARQLRHLGYCAQLAEDGRVGLKMLEHVRPNCIFLDLSFRIGMNGFAFRTEQRARGLDDAPVVLFTGDPNGPDIAPHIGAIRALIKPVGLEGIQDCLESIGVFPAACEEHKEALTSSHLMLVGSADRAAVLKPG